MTQRSEAAMQRQLAKEFSNRGWVYDLEVGPAILEDVALRGTVDADKAAAAVPRGFLDTNGATRADLAEAIGAAIGGFTLELAQPSSVTIVTSQDNRHQINLGPGAQITGGSINAGNQILAQTDSSKQDLLAAVSALVSAGLNGEWDDAAGRDLSAVVGERPDITVEEVRDVTTGVLERQGPEPSRAREFLAQVAAGAMGGSLSRGIVEALALLM